MKFAFVADRRNLPLLGPHNTSYHCRFFVLDRSVRLMRWSVGKIMCVFGYGFCILIFLVLLRLLIFLALKSLCSFNPAAAQLDIVNHA